MRRGVMVYFCLVVVALAVCVGCKSTSVVWLKPDGSSIRASDRRLFLSTQANLDVAASTNGEWSLKADVKSDPHAEAIKSATEAAVSAAVKALGK